MTAIWSIVIHGGADATRGRSYGHIEAHMAGLVDEAAVWLARGDKAVDVAQRAVQILEATGHHIAGKGASPNQDGVWELDAAIMDGWHRLAGAVSALEGFISPVAVARDVMDVTPHVLLAGAGAARLARARGHAEVGDPRAYYDPAVKDVLPANAAGHGTVGAVVLDTHGALAAATSTGGLLNKTPGRVGDSPIIGAGTWADRHVAVSCTGEGEYFLRVAAAASVAARVRYGGEAVPAAAEAVIGEVGALGGKGGLIAVGADGSVATPFNSAGMKRAAATSAGRREVQIFGR